MPPLATEEAAAASRSSPELPATEGEKMGSLGSVVVTVVTEPARGIVWLGNAMTVRASLCGWQLYVCRQGAAGQ